MTAKWQEVAAMSLEVTEIAATVSEEICNLSPSYIHVARVLPGSGKRRTVEMAWDDSPRGNFFDIDAFWPNKDCPLLADEKRTYFWQYYRSMGCDQFTAILASVFKSLCDNNICLVHNKQPVVDILALNCLEFDVSDILSSPDKALKLHDPVTDTTVPAIATHATMEQMYNLGGEMCIRLGKHQPDKETIKSWAKMKQHIPDAYNSTVPHWWLAVVVEGLQSTGEKAYTMIHLDLCGAAYDPSSLVTAPTSKALVSLKVFTTPEYDMVPNPELSHKLFMTPTLSKRAAGGRSRPPISLQPKSLRHFRCYHMERKKVNVAAASIEVTPLEKFIEHRPIDETTNAKIKQLIHSLQNTHLKSLPEGTEVVVCNIQSKPELNGRHGIIKKAREKDHIGSDRIPVLVNGLRMPISLKPVCILLPHQKQPYRTLEELKKSSIDEKIVKKEVAIAKQQVGSLTAKQKSQIKKKLNDPVVLKVLQSAQSMKTGFTRLADPEYKRGVKELIQFPLSTILPQEALNTFRQSYELSNHPKAGAAIQIINLLKMAKQRLMTEQPECVRSDGTIEILKVIPGSEIMRVQESVKKRIKNDKELAYVFERLDEIGLYVNPAK